MMYRNKKLREAARGRDCTLRGPTCTGGGEDTCFRHSNELAHGKSTGNKSNDIFGAWTCQACEWWYDGTDNSSTPLYVRRVAFHEANERTLIIACDEGLLNG